MVTDDLPRVWRLPLDDRPRIRTAVRAPLDDRRFAVRYLGDHHALHLYDYAGLMRLGRRELALRPGDMTLTPSGVASWYDLPRPGTHLVIHFGSALASGGSRDAAALPLHLSLGDRRGQAEVRMMQILHLHAQAPRSRLAEAGASTALQSLLLWLAMQACAAPGEGGSTTDRAVQSAVALIDRNIARKLSVPNLARQVGLSQNYLARQFAARMGMTMQQYQTARRIELARELIVGTDLPIKTIGQRVGLPDPQHFNKVFRKHARISPTALRAQT